MSRRFVPAAGRFVPATGLGIFLRWYDPAVRLFTAHDTIVEELIRLVGGRQRILDVGCGSGILAIRLAAIPDASVDAIDIDSRILAQATAKPGHEAVRWHCGPSSPLPFPDAQFDCVVSCLLSHHLTDTQKLDTFREAKRVTAEGGQFVLADFSVPGSLLAKMQFLPVRMLDGWQQTRSNYTGELPNQLKQVFPTVELHRTLNSLLGTIRIYVCQDI